MEGNVEHWGVLCSLKGRRPGIPDAPGSFCRWGREGRRRRRRLGWRLHRRHHGNWRLCCRWRVGRNQLTAGKGGEKHTEVKRHVVKMDMEKGWRGEGENVRREGGEGGEGRRWSWKGYHVNYFDTQTEQPFQVDVSRARCNAILHLTRLSSLYCTSAHTHIQAVWLHVKHTFRTWKHIHYVKRSNFTLGRFNFKFNFIQLNSSYLFLFYLINISLRDKWNPSVCTGHKISPFTAPLPCYPH